MAAFGAVREVEAVAEQVRSGNATEAIDWGRNNKFVVNKDRYRGELYRSDSKGGA